MSTSEQSVQKAINSNYSKHKQKISWRLVTLLASLKINVLYLYMRLRLRRLGLLRYFFCVRPISFTAFLELLWITIKIFLIGRNGKPMSNCQYTQCKPVQLDG